MVPIAAVIALISIGSAAASERHQICFSCRGSTANSPCHLEPPRKGDGTERCGERPSHCVIDRLQNEDGTFVSIERRCSTRDETKAAHNKCVKTDSDQQRCLTLCYGDFCNSGTGQLIEDDGSWDYDDPDYSDNIYDPHDAVLANRKRPYSGPFPVGTAEFPVGEKGDARGVKGDEGGVREWSCRRRVGRGGGGGGDGGEGGDVVDVGGGDGCLVEMNLVGGLMGFAGSSECGDGLKSSCTEV